MQRSISVADWKSAIPLLEDLTKQYPTDETITVRLQKAKAESAKLETTTPPQPTTPP